MLRGRRISEGWCHPCHQQLCPKWHFYYSVSAYKGTHAILMSKWHRERRFVGDKKLGVLISFPLIYLLVMNHTVDGWLYIASCSKNAWFVQVSVRLLEDTIDSSTSVLHYIQVRSLYDSCFFGNLMGEYVFFLYIYFFIYRFLLLLSEQSQLFLYS